jgi:transcriptional regulator with XRE-family HTH domain
MSKTSLNLKRLMVSNHLTQVSAAKQIGLTQSTLQRILSDEIKNPKTNQLLPICDYFGITLDQLIGRDVITASDTVTKLSANQKELLDLMGKLTSDNIGLLLAYGAGLAAAKK